MMRPIWAQLNFWKQRTAPHAFFPIKRELQHWALAGHNSAPAGPGLARGRRPAGISSFVLTIRTGMLQSV